MVTNIVRIKIKGCGHKTMKLFDSEPDFYSMPALDDANKESDSSSCSSRSIRTVQPPTAVTVDSTVGHALQKRVPLYPPRPSGVSLTAMCDLPRLLSSNEQLCHHRFFPNEGETTRNASSCDFVARLNQAIIVQELAMVCATLCKLRKDTRSV